MDVFDLFFRSFSIFDSRQSIPPIGCRGGLVAEVADGAASQRLAVRMRQAGGLLLHSIEKNRRHPLFIGRKQHLPKRAENPSRHARSIPSRPSPPLRELKTTGLRLRSFIVFPRKPRSIVPDSRSHLRFHQIPSSLGGCPLLRSALIVLDSLRGEPEGREFDG